MTTILVTGGTGGLGAPTVRRLRESGHDVRVLSRKSGDYRGDLVTGEGLSQAASGAEVVVHLATRGSKDPMMTRRLLAAAKSAKVSHFFYMSIVGVDRIDFSYYRGKHACEQLVEGSGIPFTILRATQFHTLPDRLLDLPLPVRLALPVSLQPIETDEVAARVAELAVGDPAGRVADIGGPEVLTFREMARVWNEAHHSRRPTVTIPLRGKAIRGFTAGYQLTGTPGFGSRTFAQFAAERR